MDRYYWRDENVPDAGDVLDLCVYDRQVSSQEPIALCTDPDIAERIVQLLNMAEASGPAVTRELIDSAMLWSYPPTKEPTR